MTSLRGRTRDSSWQWLLIGLVLGLGCSGVLCVGGYALGMVRLNIPGLNTDLAAVPTAAAIQTEPTLAPTQPQPTAIQPTSTTGSAAANVNSTLSPTMPLLVPTQLPATGGAPTQIVLTQPAVGTDIPSPTATTATGGVVTNLGAATPAPGGIGQPTLAFPTLSGATGGAASPSGLTLTELVAIRGGSFVMGTKPEEAARAIEDCVDRDKGNNCQPGWVEDSIPEHTVYISNFSIERFEVTHAQFVAFLNTLGASAHLNGCEGNPCAKSKLEEPNSHIEFDGVRYVVVTSSLYDNRPITFVTWWGAKKYCEYVGRRLPTEAEWEYAARGNDGRLYPWGSAWDPNYALTSRPVNTGGPNEIQLYPQDLSPFGVRNMAGNVSEWVADWYDAAAYRTTPPNAIDPKGPPSGTRKVARGGDWDALPLFARSVHRRDGDPLGATGYLGFRCASNQSVIATPAISAGTPSAAIPPGATPLASGVSQPAVAATPRP